MAKLQLYITRSMGTYNSQLNLNPNEDVRAYIKDIRQVLSIVNYDADEKNIFYLLTSRPSGIFVTILRTIPHNPGDHLAAWIFIPYNIEYEQSDLVSVVKQTTRIISAVKVTDNDISVLRTIFSRDYAIRHDAPRNVAMNASGEWAWRLYGGDNAPAFETFFGDGLWQQCYLPYRGILLVDADLGLTPEAADLTDCPIGAPATILPPEKSDDGFEPYVYGMKLDTPIRATVGDRATIIWRRQGFDNVTETFEINAAEITPKQISTDDSRKIISTASFRITSQTTHVPVNNCTIRVNSREITAEGIAFTRNELTQASIEISAEGFAPYRGRLDLATLTQALIQLQERRKVYRFEVPVKSSDLGAPVKFQILSQKPLTDSPLEGYELTAEAQEGTGHINRLRYTKAGVWQYRHAISAGAGFVLGIILMLLMGTCSEHKEGKINLAPAANPDSIVETQVETPKTEPPTVITEEKKDEPTTVAAPVKEEAAQAAPQEKQSSKQQIEAAVKYLDNSKIWTRSEMEKLPALRGLYDDMNNLRYERIIEVWGPKLSGSKLFADVYNHAKLGKSKKERVLKKGNTYNKPGDETISHQSYLNRIDP